MTQPANYKCKKCRQMKSRHGERDGAFYCESGGEATFERWVASPHRVSNSFTKDEVDSLDYITTRVLNGSFGQQPQKVTEAMQSLKYKARGMLEKLEAQRG